MGALDAATTDGRLNLSGHSNQQREGRLVVSNTGTAALTGDQLQRHAAERMAGHVHPPSEWTQVAPGQKTPRSPPRSSPPRTPSPATTALGRRERRQHVEVARPALHGQDVTVLGPLGIALLSWPWWCCRGGPQPRPPVSGPPWSARRAAGVTCPPGPTEPPTGPLAESPTEPPTEPSAALPGPGPPGSRPRSADHRDARPHQASTTRARWPWTGSTCASRGRGLRPPRPERRRQDDHDPHAARA